MREHLTSALELVGFVLLTAGGALWVGGRFGLAAAVAVEGAGLILVSLLLVETAAVVALILSASAALTRAISKAKHTLTRAISKAKHRRDT